ncbi:MAG: hypothetical protein VKQ33_11265 [Candidatus Sericytochromatia bacterium]|nr:hypothetical protein [Candidatus Sericytochromatia bacterium]
MRTRAIPVLMLMAAVLAAPSVCLPVSGAGAPRVDPATWDARQGELLIPYQGAFPRHRVLREQPLRVVVEFDAAPGMVGVFSADSPAHPRLRHWVLFHHAVDRVRLVLTLLEPSRVVVAKARARQAIVVRVLPPAAQASPPPVVPWPATPRPAFPSPGQPSPAAPAPAAPSPVSPVPAAPASPSPAAPASPSPAALASPSPGVPAPAPVVLATPAPVTPTPVPPLVGRGTAPPTTATVVSPPQRGPAAATVRPWVLPGRVWRVSLTSGPSRPAAASAASPRPSRRPSGGRALAVSPSPRATVAPRAAATVAPRMAAPPAPSAAGQPFRRLPLPAGDSPVPVGLRAGGWGWTHRAAVWFVPGGLPAGPAFRPAAVVEAAGWHGPWGGLAALSVFGEAHAPTRSQPYLQAGTPMVDLQLRRRLEAPGFFLMAGYRGLGLGNLSFATVGLGASRVLPWPWLRLEARGLGGHNLGYGAGWRSCLEGQLLLTARGRAVGLSLGVRHLSMMSAVEPTVGFTGPVVGVRWGP